MRHRNLQKLVALRRSTADDRYFDTITKPLVHRVPTIVVRPDGGVDMLVYDPDTVEITIGGMRYDGLKGISVGYNTRNPRREPDYAQMELRTLATTTSGWLTDDFAKLFGVDDGEE